ncbi:MAG TPA: stress response translation initiation inhibitor YciH [Nitrososphaeraceae archaeon]|nr:stress response translation initiation inhibitor YciH [Nitrososphaeraceae archaeon]
MLEENDSASLSIDEIVHQLDLEDINIVISKQIKKFNKLTTVIRGVDDSENVRSISKELKTKLGTGGTIKDGQIILQGDHREAVKKLLVARGFKQELIEIL